jgi:hypothetical protein
LSDKRLWFFLAAGAVCGLMVPLAPPDLRWVPEVTAVTYDVLAVLVAIDSISRSRRSRP